MKRIRRTPTLVLCSRNRSGMETVDLPCSRNARPQKALVERAQWEVNQPPSLRDNERAWKDQLDG